MRAAMKVKKQYDLIHTDTCKQKDINTPDPSSVSIDGDIMFVKVDYRIVRTSLAEIRYIESQSEYMKIHLCNGMSLMVLLSIKRMTEQLPSDKFIRIHRSYIVNMSHVKEIARTKIHMDSEIILPIGDSYKDDVVRYVNDRLIGKESV